MKSIITKYIFLLKFSYEAAKPLVKVNFANSKLNTIKNKIESGDSRPFFVTKPELKLQTTGCPKIKLALGKHLEVAIHGFKLCFLYGKKEKLGSNPSRPFLGHP